MIEFTKEDAMQNIEQLDKLQSIVKDLRNNESVPFTAGDVKLMIGLIKHLALAANYIEE